MNDDLAGLPAVLTPEEARRVLRIGRRQMYQALDRGDVRGVRIGASWRIPRSAVEELLGNENEKAVDIAETPTAKEEVEGVRSLTSP